MRANIKVLDCHMHLLTADTQREALAWLPPMSPPVAAAARRRLGRYEREQNVPSAQPADETVAAAAGRWLSEFDQYGVTAAVFLPLAPRPDTLRRFAARQPERLIPFTFVNPWEAGADKILEEDILQRGFRGLKLYPSIQGFHASDERAYAVYAQAEALSCPILFHFGVTLDYRSDLRYSNPLDLHPVARDFPGLALVVAHAGAGFFRETLMLAYHCANILVDTSGSGTWMRYLPRPLTRRDVVERLLDVFGPERILYGSDSRHASEGYRHWLLREHREILETLRVPEDDQRKILGGNMARLLQIPW
ncbi:MAG: amidohydrolase family protein [candidate division NC10 bacterium]|nr:amidohydrolase family protein [candidate division NC10 bacterium]